MKYLPLIIFALLLTGCGSSPNAVVKMTCSSDGHVQSIEVPPWVLEKAVKEGMAANLCAGTIPADNSAAAPRPDNQLPTTVNYGPCSITCP